MKVILDTNVLVSGIFFKGVPNQILLEWDDCRHQTFLMSDRGRYDRQRGDKIKTPEKT